MFVIHDKPVLCDFGEVTKDNSAELEAFLLDKNIKQFHLNIYWSEGLGNNSNPIKYNYATKDELINIVIEGVVDDYFSEETVMGNMFYLTYNPSVIYHLDQGRVGYSGAYGSSGYLARGGVKDIEGYTIVYLRQPKKEEVKIRVDNNTNNACEVR